MITASNKQAIHRFQKSIKVCMCVWDDNITTDNINK